MAVGKVLSYETIQICRALLYVVKYLNDNQTALHCSPTVVNFQFLSFIIQKPFQVSGLPLPMSGLCIGNRWKLSLYSKFIGNHFLVVCPLRMMGKLWLSTARH